MKYLARLKEKFLQMPLKIKMDKTLPSFIVGSTCLFLSAFIWWLSTPLQWKVNGYSIPIIGNPLSIEGFTKTFKIFSFGSISFLLCLLSIFFYTTKAFRKLLLFVGILGIMLSVYFIFKLVFLDPKSLETIIYQQNQYNNIFDFSTRFLNNVNLTQSSIVKVDTTLFSNRIKIAVMSISIGWYVTLVGSLLLTTVSRFFFQKGYKRILVISLFLFLLLIFLPYKHLILAEIYVIKANKNLSLGFSEKAAETYNKARVLNPNLSKDLSYVTNVGFADYLNRNESSAAHFFMGKIYQGAGLFRKSLSEYDEAKKDRSLNEIVSRREANLFENEGVKDYKMEKNYTAISNFMNSVKNDPFQFQSHFFLSKIYLDIYKHDQYPTYIESTFLLSLCNEKLLRADIYNLLGDSYYKALRFSEARGVYNKSLQSFHLVRRIINFNAMKGLQGL